MVEEVCNMAAKFASIFHKISKSYELVRQYSRGYFIIQGQYGYWESCHCLLPLGLHEPMVDEHHGVALDS